MSDIVEPPFEYPRDYNHPDVIRLAVVMCHASCAASEQGRACVGCDGDGVDYGKRAEAVAALNHFRASVDNDTTFGLGRDIRLARQDAQKLLAERDKLRVERAAIVERRTWDIRLLGSIIVVAVCMLMLLPVVALFLLLSRA